MAPEPGEVEHQLYSTLTLADGDRTCSITETPSELGVLRVVAWVCSKQHQLYLLVSEYTVSPDIDRKWVARQQQEIVIDQGNWLGVLENE
jgi:hypothetical protein